jgi:hypothetical protein
MKKIIRTICVFSDTASSNEIALLNSISETLQQHNFTIQTKRICLPRYHPDLDDALLREHNIMVGFGSHSRREFSQILPQFLSAHQRRLTLDLTNGEITSEDIEPLFTMMKHKPEATFGFAFGYNLPVSTPFFPSASFGQRGFSVGLQATDLSAECQTLDEWFVSMKATWDELDTLLRPFNEYIGIDSSIAPLYAGEGSLVHFVRRLGYTFSHSATTDVYSRMTSFIKTHNPRPVGLCGLMFPCLEDFLLADEYEQGHFPIERNLFLSLHCGLGIDTYPIGIDESPERVLEIARLVQQLSNRFKKPLSIRFVSDGKAAIGQRSHFANPILRDVVIRPL